ncbi:MAG TPA: hypothetical protein PLQ85_06085 [Anaerolineae bacterium]|nr:hypothetical protein [Anaerolineae bacterium]HQJ11474.1 hypothetical protein [Anaerolineae bacterium]HUM36421.1 hypothetical protein [Anaerolineae bacterium]
MNPQVGQTWFRVAISITLVSLVLLFFQQPGTAEFIVTALALGVGVIMTALIILIVRKSQ